MLFDFDDPFSPFVSQLTRTAAFVPAADLTVSDGDLVLTTDVPGLRVEDLAIELQDGYLTVRGERARPSVGEGTQWVHTERAWGRFERRIKVPDGVDADAITASIDNGVLSLIVPKPERMKPKTIVIAGGAPERKQLETA